MKESAPHIILKGKLRESFIMPLTHRTSSIHHTTNMDKPTQNQTPSICIDIHMEMYSRTNQYPVSQYILVTVLCITAQFTRKRNDCCCTPAKEVGMIARCVQKKRFLKCRRACRVDRQRHRRRRSDLLLISSTKHLLPLLQQEKLLLLVLLTLTVQTSGAYDRYRLCASS